MAATPICPCSSCFASTSQSVQPPQQRHQQQTSSGPQKSKTGGDGMFDKLWQLGGSSTRPGSAASTLVGWPADVARLKEGKEE